MVWKGWHGLQELTLFPPPKAPDAIQMGVRKRGMSKLGIPESPSLISRVRDPLGPSLSLVGARPTTLSPVDGLSEAFPRCVAATQPQSTRSQSSQMVRFVSVPPPPCGLYSRQLTSPAAPRTQSENSSRTPQFRSDKEWKLTPGGHGLYSMNCPRA